MMKRVRLLDICHARSGDKGDTANIGLIARDERLFPFIRTDVTAERVADHFRGIVKGKVERYELPHLWALNFVLHQALGGGGTRTLRNDAQGKTLAAALLRMEVEIDEELLTK